jgi:hypothetical protein
MSFLLIWSVTTVSLHFKKTLRLQERVNNVHHVITCSEIFRRRIEHIPSSHLRINNTNRLKPRLPAAQVTRSTTEITKYNACYLSTRCTPTELIHISVFTYHIS